MKKMMIASLVMVLAAGVDASVISVNLHHSGSSPMASDQSAGVVGESRAAYWNDWQIDGTLGFAGSVLDSTGATVSGLSVSRSGSALHPYNGDGSNDGDRAMESDFIDIRNGETVTWSVANVPYAQYDVYVYMLDDGASRAGSFTLGSTTYYARGPATGKVPNTGIGWVRSADITEGGGTDIDQGNYVRFEGVTGSSFTMDCSTVYAGDSAWRNKVAGFQIVSVPEPATIGLIGMASVGLIVARRFRM